DDGRELWFTDPRRFGEAFLIDDAKLDERFERLGVEPLSAGFTPEVLGELAAGRTAPPKSFLLDQSPVAGVGNLYADEGPFRARPAPALAGGVDAARAPRGAPRRHRRRARGRDRRRRRLDRRLPRRARRARVDAGRVPRPHPRGGGVLPLRRDDRPDRRRRPLDLLLPRLPGPAPAPAAALAAASGTSFNVVRSCPERR